MKKPLHNRGHVSPSASPPCLLHEVNGEGIADVDAQQARDVARWRRIRRDDLIRARGAMSRELRAAGTARMELRLLETIKASGIQSPVVSGYWPIRAEPDLRDWMAVLRATGIQIALPMALALKQPLVFKLWDRGARMSRGLWNIPYPAEGSLVVPDIVIAPLVGFDRAGYRLGYGGGFFDRTLAGLIPKPLTLGVGFPEAELPTIFPQPHDVPMDWIITPDEAFGVACQR